MLDGTRKLRLQVRPRAEVDKSRLERLLGTALPGGPKEKINNDASAYWLAPNDWLLVNPAPGYRQYFKCLT